MLWSPSKAVVSLFLEEDADSNGHAVQVPMNVAGLSCCTPWLRSPSPCPLSVAAAKLQHIAHTVLVFQKTLGPRNKLFYKIQGKMS